MKPTGEYKLPMLLPFWKSSDHKFVLLSIIVRVTHPNLKEQQDLRTWDENENRLEGTWQDYKKTSWRHSRLATRST